VQKPTISQIIESAYTMVRIN